MNCPEEWRTALDLHPFPPPRTGLTLLARPGVAGDDSLLQALQLGACGIVCKEHGFHRIAQSICHASAGQSLLDSAAISGLVERYFRPLHLNETAEANQAERLTSRERQVMQLIGEGYSNKDIARETKLGYSTVKNYVSSILKKLRLDGRTQIALYSHKWDEGRSSSLRRHKK
jgi:two-component system response regulator DevR